MEIRCKLWKHSTRHPFRGLWIWRTVFCKKRAFESMASWPCVIAWLANFKHKAYRAPQVLQVLQAPLRTCWELRSELRVLGFHVGPTGVVKRWKIFWLNGVRRFVLWKDDKGRVWTCLHDFFCLLCGTPLIFTAVWDAKCEANQFGAALSHQPLAHIGHIQRRMQSSSPKPGMVANDDKLWTKWWKP